MDERITKERALAYAKQNIDQYKLECVSGIPSDRFWRVASGKYNELFKEVRELKQELEDGHDDVQQYVLKTKVFENKSIELIRCVAVEILIRKEKSSEKF